MVQSDIKPDDDNKYYTILNDWKTKLEIKLQESLPQLNPTFLPVLCASCSAVQAATKSRDDALAVWHELQHQDADMQKKNAAVMELAQLAVADTEQAVQDSLNTSQRIAVDLFLDENNDGLQHLLSGDFDDTDLILYTVLCHGTVQGLATWCHENPQGDAGADQLLEALQEAPLMRLFLESGGPRHGMYGNVLICYQQLLLSSTLSLSCSTRNKNSKKINNDNDDDCYDSDDDRAVLNRLALAVALEVGADPYPYFDPTAHSPPVTDPIQRYVHYEQAYLLGELDPAFASFTVWEMRHVVNSDATNEELGWGRQCLLNYRPDIALPTAVDGSLQWQYCYIVRTDVPYRDVDFYKGHKSYDQILSSGGKCGPRAWYGRFIAKAFGIPTWGVVQPGHAAMTRWTRDQGWMTCLGAGFEYSWWEDQGGLDFLLETRARSACQKTKQSYMKKVLRLEWISQYFYKEDLSMVRMQGLPDPKSPWCSLGMMQRRRLSTSGSCVAGGVDSAIIRPRHEMIPKVQKNKNNSNNKIAQLMALQEEIKSPLFVPDVISCNYRTGDIVIPASCCTSPKQTTDKVFFLPCISGGPKQQLHVEQDAEIEYTLSLRPSSTSTDTCQQYQVSFCVCTVHRAEQPIRITVSHISSNSDNPDTEYVVKMPYTVGMWQETEPIVIQIAAGDSCTKLRVMRPNQDDSKGFSFKEIRLVPVS